MDSINYIDLNDYRLWVDGDISFNSEQLLSFIFSGGKIEEAKISYSDEEILKYKRLFKESLPKKEKLNDHKLQEEFNIPQEFKDCNIKSIIYKKLEAHIDSNNYSEEENLERLSRVLSEYNLYKKHGLLDVLKLCHYIVKVLECNNIVWGPGRGSACCSYILFLLGLHDVDSFKFNLDINEFLRD